MFWTLFLAHLLADYPFQPDGIVRAKRTWSGLVLHVTIHFITMVVLVWPSIRFVWPQLLALAGLHFAIDAFKNLLATRKPNWIVGPYLFDQFLHLLSIAIVAFWMLSSHPGARPLLPASWAILIIGYLLATYVWYITERVFVHSEPAYVKTVQATRWSRIVLRGGLLTLGILLFSLTTTSLAWVILPPFSTSAGRRALLTDIVVVAGVLIFIRLAFTF